jgi:hypothetical protein
LLLFGGDKNKNKKAIKNQMQESSKEQEVNYQLIHLKMKPKVMGVSSVPNIQATDQISTAVE